MFDLFKSKKKFQDSSLKNKEEKLKKPVSLKEKAEGIEKSLESDLAKFQGVVKSLEKELDLRNSHINSLELKTSRMVEKKEVNLALAKVTDLKSKLDSNVTLLASKEEKFKKQVSILNKAISVLKTDKLESENVLKHNLSISNSKLKNFNIETKKLKLQFDDLQNQFSKTIEKNNELKKKISSVNSLISTKENEFSDFKRLKESELKQAKGVLRSFFEESFSKKERFLVEKFESDKVQFGSELASVKSKLDAKLLLNKKQVSDLRNKIASLNGLISTKESEFSDFKREKELELKRAEGVLKSSFEERFSGKEKAIAEKFKNKENQLQKEIESKNAEMSSRLLSSSKRTIELKEKINSLNQLLSSKEKELNAEYNSMKSELDSKINELSKHLKFSEDALIKQKRTISSHYESEMHSLNKQVSKISSDFNGVNKKLIELEKFNDSLKHQVKESASALKEAKDHMSIAEKEAAKQVESIEKSSKSEISKIKKTLETENKRLGFRNQDIEKQLVELASKNSVLISELQRKNDALQSKISSEISDNSALKKQLAELHSVFLKEQKENKLSHNTSDFSIQKLQDEIEAFRVKCSNLNNRLAKEKEVFKQREGKIQIEVRGIVESEFASKINALEKQKTRLLNEKSKLVSESTNKNTALEVSLKKDFVKKSSIFDKKQQMFEEEKAKLVAKIDESESKFAESNSEITEMKNALKDSVKENDSLRNLIDEKDATIEKIEKQIEMIENHLNQL